MPRFPALEQQGLLLARRLTPLRFTLGERTFEATVFDGRLASQVDLVVVDVPGLFDRAGVYGERGEDYPDNALRFAALSRAAAELVRQRAAAGRLVDVVHCNDWPTALVPTYLRALAAETPALAATRTVLTIHNVAHQGVFPKDTLPAVGLGWEHFHVDGIEFYGGMNFLKQGIVTADAVTTVSPTYAREIQTPEHGAKLDGVLRARGEALLGIVNGVDYAVWNPATDPALAARYDAEDFTQQGALQGRAPEGARAPARRGRRRSSPASGASSSRRGATSSRRRCRSSCAGPTRRSSSRATASPALVAAVETAVAQVATGAPSSRARRARPLVHRIFAGADLVLVPSRYEPCGLVQLYAQRYGALPVAHATGGLVDTIVDCDAKLETGTGFLFDEPTRRRAPRRHRARARRPHAPALARRSCAASCASTAAGSAPRAATSSSIARSRAR